MKFKATSLSVLAIALFSASSVSARLIVDFDYTTDTSDFFASGGTARASLEAAGNFFEQYLFDDLNSIVDDGNTFTTWSLDYTHPATGNSASALELSVAADSITIFVGARDLGGSTLGQAGPGGFSVTGTQAFLDNLYSRGEGTANQAAVDGASANETAPWGGSLAIDSDSTWNLDHTASPSAGENDLYSVILHEIGHVLGMGIADSWDNLINASDEFTGTVSVAEHGGNVPLQSTHGHWAAGTTSTVFLTSTSQEAAMDPNITVGTRKVFTDLDMAGLDDIGWDVNPEPSTFVLTGLGILGAAAIRRFRRRRRGSGQSEEEVVTTP